MTVAPNVIRVPKVQFMLLFGDLNWVLQVLYKTIFFKKISFLLNPQPLLTQTDVLIHRCSRRGHFLIALAWMQVSLFCISLLIIYLHPLLLLLCHFSSVFLSHLFPSANAQHCRVCGVQPIQPPCLQQLQTGREPKQQQSGNGMNINRVH